MLLKTMKCCKNWSRVTDFARYDTAGINNPDRLSNPNNRWKILTDAFMFRLRASKAADVPNQMQEISARHNISHTYFRERVRFTVFPSDDCFPLDPAWSVTAELKPPPIVVELISPAISRIYFSQK